MLAPSIEQPTVPDLRAHVLLAVGDTRLRAVTRALLAQQRGVTVVAEAATATEVQHAARLFQPDLVLLDLDLPGLRMPRLVRALRSLPGAPRVVLLAWDDDDEYRAAALRAGASLCLSKRRLDALVPQILSA